MKLHSAARVILIGAPGVGKGTQSERLLARFPQLQSISAGDLLRHNVAARTPLGLRVESTMASGALVEDSLMLRIITGALRERGWLPPDDTPADLSADPDASFILDGYPRTASQAATLDTLVPINLAVSLRTPFEVVLGRIAGRWVHEPSGRVYNTTFHPPRVKGRDDVTGEPLIQRVDDDEETYRARFRRFEESSEPLREHYAKRGVLLEVEGLSSDEISPKLYGAFEGRFVRE